MKIPRTAAVLTGIALVAFISFVALFSGITLVTFISLVTLFAVCAVNACRFYAGVGFSDPPVAVFTNEWGVAVRTIGAVLSVCSILAVGSVLSVYTILAVKTFQNRKIVQVQPYFIADIAPLQGVFAYTELRCLSVCSVCTFLPGGTCDVGYRHKVLPLIALVTPLYVGFSSLHLYAFGVNAVSAVDTVFAVGTVNSILAVFSIGFVFTVNSVNAVFSVCAVYSVLTVGTIRAVFTVCAVLSVFSGSAPQLGKRHKVVPVGFVAVFPLNRRAVVSYLRQCVACFCCLAPSYCKHAAKHQKSGAKRQKCTCE